MRANPLSVLQAFRFGASDRDHVARLLHWAEFSAGQRVVDLGAGSGAVASHMASLRPDLHFCLIDKDGQRLPRDTFDTHVSDITCVPEPDGSFDAAIAMYTVGYVPCCQAFEEIHRLLRPGGIAFLVDMVPKDSNKSSIRLFGYEVRSRALIETAAQEAGLLPDVYIEPHDPGDWGRSVFSDAFDIFFGDVRPAIWRFYA